MELVAGKWAKSQPKVEGLGEDCLDVKIFDVEGCVLAGI